MTARTILEPGPSHPITVVPNPNRVIIRVDGRTVADTRNALTLTEASYPPVPYIPMDDVDQSQLVATDHSTYCPYKGEASYYSLPDAGAKGENAVWQYQLPYPSVSEIKNLVAFYADRVEIIEEP